MFFSGQTYGAQKFFSMLYDFNWSLTSPVILDIHAAAEPSLSRSLTEIVVIDSTVLTVFPWILEVNASKTKDDKIVLQRVGFEISRERKGLPLQSRKMAKRWQSSWKTHWNYRGIEFHEFLSKRSELLRPPSGGVVTPLVCINIDSFGAIICYNLFTGITLPKIFFHCFLEIKIRASWGYVLTSKSETQEPIWLKFGQLTVR